MKNQLLKYFFATSFISSIFSPLSLWGQTPIRSWPIEKASVDVWPTFKDNLEFERMSLAIDRQLQVMEKDPEIFNISTLSETFSKEDIVKGLKSFRQISLEVKSCLEKNFEKQICWDQLNTKLKEDFEVYRPVLTETDKGYQKEADSHFTGYYSPELEASLQPGGEFQYPIYARPSSKDLREKTRVEIDFDGALEGLGLELAYATNLYDLYTLHIQGGGALKITEADGSITRKFLSYASGNGHKFSFIYPYMKSKGYISGGSIEEQRDFITNNPDKQREIFDVCPNYIFFKITDHEPLGVDGIILTEGRSIAQDIGIYRTKGLIAYVEGILPQREESGSVKKKTFSRFFLDQDTGGAIKGRARADLYLGFGEEARIVANHLNHMGKIYFILPKAK